MTRQTAWEILNKYLKNPVLIKHSLAVEAVMRALAPRFHDDVEMWGITGLLHDADYDKAKGMPEKHGKLLFDLEPNSIPTVIEHAIKAHNNAFTKVLPESPMDWALYCSDELTGLVTAIALLQKDKLLSGLTSEMILSKIKQKDFVKKADKQTFLLCEDKLGIPVGEFVEITLRVMQGIHVALEL